MKVEKIIIDNLKCSGCAATISKQLKKMQGVAEVHINHENSEVMVEGNETLVRDDLVAKLTSLGYPEEGTSNVLQKAKSYVSCAIGRMEN